MIRTYGSTVIQGIGDGKCKRDIGLIVDAVAEDLRDGGNANIIAATREYFDGDGNPLTNGLVGEEDYATMHSVEQEIYVNLLLLTYYQTKQIYMILILTVT